MARSSVKSRIIPSSICLNAIRKICKTLLAEKEDLLDDQLKEGLDQIITLADVAICILEPASEQCNQREEK